MKVITEEEIAKLINKEWSIIDDCNREIARAKSKKKRAKDRLDKLYSISPNQIEMDFDKITF